MKHHLTDTREAGKCLIDFSGKDIQQNKSFHISSFQRWSEVVIAFFYFSGKRWIVWGSKNIMNMTKWRGGSVSGIMMPGDSLHFLEIWFSYHLGMMVLLSLLWLKSVMDRNTVKLPIIKVKPYLMWGDICNIKNSQKHTCSQTLSHRGPQMYIKLLAKLTNLWLKFYRQERISPLWVLLVQIRNKYSQPSVTCDDKGKDNVDFIDYP